MKMLGIKAVYMREVVRDGAPTRDLVFESHEGDLVAVPLSFAWAGADLYASLSELVTARQTMTARTGRAWEGTDGRYLRAVAAVRKADGSEGTEADGGTDE